MKKAGLVIDIIFIVVTILSLCELAFVRGMFTWIIAFGATTVCALVDAGTLIARKEYHKACLVSLAALAIITGYSILL